MATETPDRPATFATSTRMSGPRTADVATRARPSAAPARAATSRAVARHAQADAARPPRSEVRKSGGARSGSATTASTASTTAPRSDPTGPAAFLEMKAVRHPTGA